MQVDEELPMRGQLRLNRRAVARVAHDATANTRSSIDWLGFSWVQALRLRGRLLLSQKPVRVIVYTVETSIEPHSEACLAVLCRKTGHPGCSQMRQLQSSFMISLQAVVM